MDIYQIAQNEVNKILSKTGLNILDLPDSISILDWIDVDMSPEQVNEIAPDIAWEILDNADMDRDLVNSICYPEESEPIEDDSISELLDIIAMLKSDYNLDDNIVNLDNLYKKYTK